MPFHQIYKLILSALITASLIRLDPCQATIDQHPAHTQTMLSLFPIENYAQQFSVWMKSKIVDIDAPLLTSLQQQAHLAKFHRHYFGKESPWHPDYIQKLLKTPDLYNAYYSKPKTLYQFVINSLDNFDNKGKSTKRLGYGSNFRLHNEAWIQQLKTNINPEQFTKTMSYQPINRAIASDNLQARRLPTEAVHLSCPQLAGSGYPLDNLQKSHIWAGTPLYILGETRDRSWLLVTTPRFIAWVKSTSVARVSQDFIAYWCTAAQKKLIAITRTQVPVVDNDNQLFRFSAYIGMVFPGIRDEASNQTHLLIPVRDRRGKANIHQAYLDNQSIASVPLAPTIRHFIQLMNQQLGRPYGRGGIYFYNDCSLDLVNLFTALGIWLPIPSTAQVDPRQLLGTLVDLSHLDTATRLEQLMRQGHPFMTIIYINGHVMLYLGAYPNLKDPQHTLVPLTYQTLWALNSLSDSGSDKRVIVGQTVLLPLLKSYPENSKIVSLANKQYFKLFHLN